MRDSAATRSRILAAAAAEFAEHGIAGARVDRIAAAARANKAQIYSYVGNKDALFDTVFAAHVAANVDTVRFTVRDLPGYAAALYDAYLADPALVRLLAWARLERRPVGDLFDSRPARSRDPHPDALVWGSIADAQRDGVLVDDIEPEDLWPMLIALAATWAQAAIVRTAHADEPARLHARRRAALERTVRRAFCR